MYREQSPGEDQAERSFLSRLKWAGAVLLGVTIGVDVIAVELGVQSTALMIGSGTLATVGAEMAMIGLVGEGFQETAKSSQP